MPRKALKPKDVASLARSHTTTCINRLAGIVQHPDSTPANVIAAANSLLDRGWGKAPQHVTNEHTGKDGGVIEIGGQDALTALLMRLEGMAGRIPSDDAQPTHEEGDSVH